MEVGKEAGGLLVDQRFGPRIVEGELRYNCASGGLRPSQTHHRGILLAAAQQNGHALGLASEVLRADHEVVMAAVRQNGVACRYVSEELRADHEVALAAMLRDGHALGESSESPAPSTRSFWRPCVGMTMHGGMPQRSSAPNTGSR